MLPFLIMIVIAALVAAELLLLGTQRIGEMLAAEAADAVNGFVGLLSFAVCSGTDAASIFIRNASSLGYLLVGQALFAVGEDQFFQSQVFGHSTGSFLLI